MKRGFLFIVAVILLGVGSVAQATDYYSYGGHTYFLTDPLSWADAEAASVAAGGHLVTVNDLAEQTWLTGIFTGESLWIGLYQLPGSVEPDQGFVWVSGQPVTFTNWVTGEPNDSNGEQCAAMNEHYAGGWNDLPPDRELRGIAEVPEPSTILAALSVFGPAGFMFRRRKV